MNTNQTITYRQPVLTDATAVLSLVEATGELDRNSLYCYLLMCHHFRETSLVALSGDKVAGFIMGYVVPGDPSTLFVWQIAVAGAAARQGIASAMLRYILTRPALQGIRFLEATVTPSNQASDALFKSFAAAAGAPLETAELFGPELFGDGAHEAEVRYRIGPLNSTDHNAAGGV